ncbi:MAG: putative metal-binding motif-containing protein [Myxococcota bacterium]
MFLLALAGCPQTVQPLAKPEETGDTGTTDTDTDTTPDDTADTDGDLDDDGFTVEEGDCDDTNIRVAPGREEDDSDGVDNDCDGRIDEEWSGLTVAYPDYAGGGELLVIDTIGRVDDAIDLGECMPFWIDHLGDGWVVNDTYAYVSVVEPDGTCTRVGDFTDAEVYEYGVWGVATAPDGTVYAVTIGSLVSVGGDGTITELATWTVDFEDPANHELAAAAVAVDPVSGEVALFDYFGGFATWSAEAGLAIAKTGDYVSPEIYSFSGAHRDGGGWYTPGIDASTGAYGVYSWGGTDWVLEESWADEDWEPVMLAIDGDSGDYYLTANAGWFYTVWRIVEGTGYAADLYATDGTEEDRAFQGIVANYTYGG